MENDNDDIDDDDVEQVEFRIGDDLEFCSLESILGQRRARRIGP